MNPQKNKGGVLNGSFVVYQILGTTHYGKLDITRRFSEFLAFRTILYQRWPGLYIPPIPHKEQKKTDKKIVEERLCFLDRFMKEVSTLPYLYESDEFKIFIMPGEGKSCEKELERLPVLSTTEQIQRLRSKIPINEGLNELQVKELNVQISEFVGDCKDLLTHLRQFKKSVKDIVPIKEKELQYYSTFTDFLIKYEQTNLKKARKEQSAQMSLVSDPNKLNLKQKLEFLSTNA